MNTKVLLSGLAAGIAGFLLGWLIYGVALMDFMNSHCTTYPGLMKEPPVLLGVFIANCCTGFLYAYIFNNWPDAKSFAGGIKAGFPISLLLALSMDIYYYSFMNMGDTTYYAVDIVVGTVMGALVAGVAGAVLGMGKKA